MARTWPGAASLSGGMGFSEQGWWAGECQEQDVRATGGGGPITCSPALAPPASVSVLTARGCAVIRVRKQLPPVSASPVWFITVALSVS